VPQRWANAPRQLSRPLETTEQHEWATGTAEPNLDILSFTFESRSPSGRFFIPFFARNSSRTKWSTGDNGKEVREAPVK
jgi:hypothetical protein